MFNVLFFYSRHFPYKMERDDEGDVNVKDVLYDSITHNPKAFLHDGVSGSENEDISIDKTVGVVERARSYFADSSVLESKTVSNLVERCKSMDSNLLSSYQLSTIIGTSRRFLHHINTYTFMLKSDIKTIGIVFNDTNLLRIFTYCQWVIVEHGTSAFKAHIPGNPTVFDVMKIICIMKKTWIDSVLSELTDHDKALAVSGMAGSRSSIGNMSRLVKTEVRIPTDMRAANTIFKWFPHFMYETGMHLGDLYCLESDGIEYAYVSGTKVKTGDIDVILAQMGFQVQFLSTKSKKLVFWIQPSRSDDILKENTAIKYNVMNESEVPYFVMDNETALQSLKDRRSMMDGTISLRGEKTDVEGKCEVPMSKSDISRIRYDPFGYVSQMGSVLCYMQSKLHEVSDSMNMLLSHIMSHNNKSNRVLRVRMLEFKNALWVFLNMDSRYIPYIPSSGTILSTTDEKITKVMLSLGFRYDTYDVEDINMDRYGGEEYNIEDDDVEMRERGEGTPHTSLRDYGVWRLPRLFCVAYGKIIYEELEKFERILGESGLLDDDVSTSRFVSEDVDKETVDVRYYSKPCSKSDAITLRREYQKYKNRTRSGSKYKCNVTSVHNDGVGTNDDGVYGVTTDNVLDLSNVTFSCDILADDNRTSRSNSGGASDNNINNDNISEYAHISLHDGHDIGHYGSLAVILYSGKIFDDKCIEYHICNNMKILQHNVQSGSHDVSTGNDTNVSDDVKRRYGVEVTDRTRAMLGRGTNMSVQQNTKYIVRRAHVDCFDYGYPLDDSGIMDSISGLSYALSFNEYLLPSTKILEQINIFDGLVVRVTNLIKGDVILPRKDADAMLLSIEILHEVFDCLLTDLVNTFVQYLKVNGVPASFDDDDAFRKIENFSTTYYFMIDQIKAMGKGNLNDFDPDDDLNRMTVIELCRIESRNKTLERIGETMSYFVFFKVSLVKMRNYVFNHHPDSRDRNSQISLLNTLTSVKLKDGIRKYKIKDNMYYDWKLNMNRFNDHKTPDITLQQSLSNMANRRKKMLEMEAIGIKLLMELHLTRGAVEMEVDDETGNRFLRLKRDELYDMMGRLDPTPKSVVDAKKIRDGWFGMVYVILLNSAWNVHLSYALTEHNRLVTNESRTPSRGDGGDKDRQRSGLPGWIFATALSKKGSNLTGLGIIDRLLNAIKRGTSDKDLLLRLGTKILNSNSNLRSMGIIDEKFYREHFIDEQRSSTDLDDQYSPFKSFKIHTARYAKDLFQKGPSMGKANIPINIGRIKVLEPLQSARIISRLFSGEYPDIRVHHDVGGRQTNIQSDSYYLKHADGVTWPELVASSLKMQGYADMIYDVTLELFKQLTTTTTADGTSVAAEMEEVERGGTEGQEYDLVESIVNDFICSIGVSERPNSTLTSNTRNDIFVKPPRGADEVSSLIAGYENMKTILEEFLPVAISIDVEKKLIGNDDDGVLSVNLYSKDDDNGVVLDVSPDDTFVETGALIDSNMYDTYYDNRFDIDTSYLNVTPISQRAKPGPEEDLSSYVIKTYETDITASQYDATSSSRLMSEMKVVFENVMKSSDYLRKHTVSNDAKNAYFEATKSMLKSSQRGYSSTLNGDDITTSNDDTPKGEYRGDLSTILKVYYACLTMIDALNDKVIYVVPDKDDINLDRYGGYRYALSVYKKLKSTIAVNIASTSYFGVKYTAAMRKLFSGYAFYDVPTDRSAITRMHTITGKYFPDMFYRRLLCIEGEDDMTCHLDTALYTLNNTVSAERSDSPTDVDLLKFILGFTYNKNYQRTYRSVIDMTRVTPTISTTSTEKQDVTMTDVTPDSDIARKLRKGMEETRTLVETERRTVESGVTMLPMSKTAMQSDYNKALYMLSQITVGNMMESGEVDPLTVGKRGLFARIKRGLFGDDVVHGFDIVNDLFDSHYGLDILTDHIYADDFAKWFLLLGRNNNVTRSISGGRPLLFLTALLRTIATVDDVFTMSDITMKLSLLTDSKVVERYAADEFVMNVLPGTSLEGTSLGGGSTSQISSRKKILTNLYGDNKRGDILMGFERDVFGATKAYRAEYKSVLNLRMSRLEAFSKFSNAIVNLKGRNVLIGSLYTNTTACKQLLPSGYIDEYTSISPTTDDTMIRHLNKKINTVKWILQSLVGDVSEKNTFALFGKQLLEEIVKVVSKNDRNVNFTTRELDDEVRKLERYGRVIYDFSDENITKDESGRTRDIITSRRLMLMEDQGLNPKYDTLSALHSAIAAQIPYMNTGINKIITADEKIKYIGRLDDLRAFNPIYTRSVRDIVLDSISKYGSSECEVRSSSGTSGVGAVGRGVSVYDVMMNVFNRKCNIVMDLTTNVLEQKNIREKVETSLLGLDDKQLRSIYDVKERVDAQISDIAVSTFMLKKYLRSVTLSASDPTSPVSNIHDDIGYVETRLLSIQQRAILANLAYINLASKMGVSCIECHAPEKVNVWRYNWHRLISGLKSPVEDEKSRLQIVYDSIAKELENVNASFQSGINKLRNFVKEKRNVILGSGTGMKSGDEESALAIIARDHVFRSDLVVTNMVQLSKRVGEFRTMLTSIIHSLKQNDTGAERDTALRSLAEINKIYTEVFGMKLDVFVGMDKIATYPQKLESANVFTPLGDVEGSVYLRMHTTSDPNVKKKLKDQMRISIAKKVGESADPRFTIKDELKVNYALMEAFKINITTWQKNPTGAFSRGQSSVKIDLKSISEMWKGRDALARSVIKIIMDKGKSTDIVDSVSNFIGTKDIPPVFVDVNDDNARIKAVGALRMLHTQSSLIPVADLILANYGLIIPADYKPIDRKMINIMWDVQNLYINRVSALIARIHAVLYSTDDEYRKRDNETFWNTKHIDNFSPDIRYLPLSNKLFDMSGATPLFYEIDSLAGKSEANRSTKGVSLEGQPIIPFDNYERSDVSVGRVEGDISVSTYHFTKPLLNVRYLLFGDPDEVKKYGPEMDISAISTHKRMNAHDKGLRKAYTAVWNALSSVHKGKNIDRTKTTDAYMSKVNALILDADVEFQRQVQSYTERFIDKRKGRVMSPDAMEAMEKALVDIIESKSYLDNLVKRNERNPVLSLWQLKSTGLVSEEVRKYGRGPSGSKGIPYHMGDTPIDKIKELSDNSVSSRDNVFFQNISDVAKVTLRDAIRRRVDILPMNSTYVNGKVNLGIASTMLKSVGANGVSYSPGVGIKFKFGRDDADDIYPISWVFSHMLVHIKGTYNDLLGYIARASKPTNDMNYDLYSIADVSKFAVGFESMVTNSREVLYSLVNILEDDFKTGKNEEERGGATVSMTAINRALSQLLSDDQTFPTDLGEILADMSNYDEDVVGLPTNPIKMIQFYMDTSPEKSSELRTILSNIEKKLDTGKTNRQGRKILKDDLTDLTSEEKAAINRILKVFVLYNFANMSGAGDATLKDILLTLGGEFANKVAAHLLNANSGMSAVKESFDMVDMLVGSGNFLGMVTKLHSLISSKFDAMTVFIALYVTISSKLPTESYISNEPPDLYRYGTLNSRLFLVHLLQIRNIVYELFRYTTIVMGLVDFLKLKGKNLHDFLASVGYEQYVRSQHVTVTRGSGENDMVKKSAYARSSAYFSNYGGIKNADEFMASIASAQYSATASMASMKGIKEALESYTNVQLRPLLGLFDEKYGKLFGSGAIKMSLSKSAKKLLTSWSSNLTFLPGNDVVSRLMYNSYISGKKVGGKIDVSGVGTTGVINEIKKELYDFEGGLSEMMKLETGLNAPDSTEDINTFLSKELITELTETVRMEEIARKVPQESTSRRTSRGTRRTGVAGGDIPVTEGGERRSRTTVEDAPPTGGGPTQATIHQATLLVNTSLSPHKKVFRSTAAGWNRLTLSLMERYTIMDLMDKMFTNHDEHLEKIFADDSKDKKYYLDLHAEMQKNMGVLRGKKVNATNNFLNKTRDVLDNAFGLGNLSNLFDKTGTMNETVYEKAMQNVRMNLLKNAPPHTTRSKSYKSKVTVEDILEIGKLENIVKVISVEHYMFGIYVNFLKYKISNISYNGGLPTRRKENYRVRYSNNARRDMDNYVSVKQYETSARMMGQMRKLYEMDKTKWEFFRHTLHHFMEEGVSLANKSKEKFNREVKKMSNFKKIVESRLREGRLNVNEETINELDEDMLSMEDHLEFGKVLMLFQFYGNLLTGDNETLVKLGQRSTSDLKNALTMMSDTLGKLETRVDSIKQGIHEDKIRSLDDEDMDIFQRDLLSFLKVTGGAVAFDTDETAEATKSTSEFTDVTSIPMVDLSSERSWSNIDTADPYQYILSALNIMESGSGYTEYMKSKYSAMFEELSTNPIVKYYYYSKYMSYLDTSMLGMDMLFKLMTITSNRPLDDRAGYFSMWKNVRNIANSNVLGGLTKKMGPLFGGAKKLTKDWLVSPVFKLIKRFVPRRSYAWIMGTVYSEQYNPDVPDSVRQLQNKHGVMGVLTGASVVMLFVAGLLCNDQSGWFSTLTESAAYVSTASSGILATYHLSSAIGTGIAHAKEREVLSHGLNGTWFNFWKTLWTKPEFILSAKSLYFSLQPQLIQATGLVMGILTGYPEATLFLGMMASFGLNVAHTTSIRDKMRMAKAGKRGVPFMGVMLTSLGSSISTQADYFDVYERLNLLPESVQNSSRKNMEKEYENIERDNAKLQRTIHDRYMNKVKDAMMCTPALSGAMDIVSTLGMDVESTCPIPCVELTVETLNDMYLDAVAEVVNFDKKSVKIYDARLLADLVTIRSVQGTEGSDQMIDESQAHLALERAGIKEIRDKGTTGLLLSSAHKKILQRDAVTTIDRIRQYEYRSADKPMSVPDFVTKIRNSGAIERRYVGNIEKQRHMEKVLIDFHTRLEKVDPTITASQDARDPMLRDNKGNLIGERSSDEVIDIVEMKTLDYEYAKEVGGAPPRVIKAAIGYTDSAMTGAVIKRAMGDDGSVEQDVTVMDDSVLGEVDLLQEITSVMVDYMKSDNVRFSMYHRDMVAFAKVEHALVEHGNVYRELEYRAVNDRDETIPTDVDDTLEQEVIDDKSTAGSPSNASGSSNVIMHDNRRYVEIGEDLWVTDNYNLAEVDKSASGEKLVGAVRYREPAYRNRKVQAWYRVDRTSFTDPFAAMQGTGGYRLHGDTSPLYKPGETALPPQSKQSPLLQPLYVNVLNPQEIGVKVDPVVLEATYSPSDGTNNIVYAKETRIEGRDDMDITEKTGISVSGIVSEDDENKELVVNKTLEEIKSVDDGGGTVETSHFSSWFGWIGMYTRNWTGGTAKDYGNATLIVDKKPGDAQYVALKADPNLKRTSKFKMFVRQPSTVAGVLSGHVYLDRIQRGSIVPKYGDVGMGRTMLPESNIYYGLTPEIVLKSQKSFPTNDQEAEVIAASADRNADYTDTLVSNHFVSSMMEDTVERLMDPIRTVNKVTVVYAGIHRIAKLYGTVPTDDDEGGGNDSTGDITVSTGPAGGGPTNSDVTNAIIKMTKHGFTKYVEAVASGRIDVDVDRSMTQTLYTSQYGEMWVDLLYGGNWIMTPEKVPSIEMISSIFKVIVGEHVNDKHMDQDEIKTMMSPQFINYKNALVDNRNNLDEFKIKLNGVTEESPREWQELKNTFDILNNSILANVPRPDPREASTPTPTPPPPPKLTSIESDKTGITIGSRLSDIWKTLVDLKYGGDVPGQTPKDVLIGFSTIGKLVEAVNVLRNGYIPETFIDKQNAQTLIDVLNEIDTDPESRRRNIQELTKVTGLVKNIFGRSSVEGGKEEVGGMNPSERSTASFLEEAALSGRGRRELMGRLPLKIVERIKTAQLNGGSGGSGRISATNPYEDRQPEIGMILKTVADHSSDVTRTISPDGIARKIYDSSPNSILRHDFTDRDNMESVGVQLADNLMQTMSDGDKASLLNMYVREDVIEPNDEQLLRRYYGIKVTRDTYYGNFIRKVAPPMIRSWLGFSTLFWDDMNRYSDKPNIMKHITKDVTAGVIRDVNAKITRDSMVVGHWQSSPLQASERDPSRVISGEKYYELLSESLTRRLHPVSYNKGTSRDKRKMILRTKGTVLVALKHYSNVAHRVVTTNASVRTATNLFVTSSLLGSQFTSTLYYGVKMRPVYNYISSIIGAKTTIGMAENMLSMFIAGDDVQKSMSSFWFNADDTVSAASSRIQTVMSEYLGTVADIAVQATVGLVERVIASAIGYVGSTALGEDVASSYVWGNYVSRATGYAAKHITTFLSGFTMNLGTGIIRYVISLFTGSMSESSAKSLLMVGSLFGLWLSASLAAIILETTVVLVLESLVYVALYIPKGIIRMVRYGYLSLSNRLDTKKIKLHGDLLVSAKRVYWMMRLKKFSSGPLADVSSVRNLAPEYKTNLGVINEGIMDAFGMKRSGDVVEDYLRLIREKNVRLVKSHPDVIKLANRASILMEGMVKVKEVGGDYGENTMVQIRGLSSGNLAKIEEVLTSLQEAEFASLRAWSEWIKPGGHGDYIDSKIRYYGYGFINWLLPMIIRLVFKLVIRFGILYIVAITTGISAGIYDVVMQGILKAAIVPAILMSSGKVLKVTDIAKSHMGWILLHKRLQGNVIGDWLIRWKRFIFAGLGISTMFAMDAFLKSALEYFGMGGIHDVLEECGLLTYLGASGLMGKVFIGSRLGDMMDNISGSLLNVLFSSKSSYRENQLIEYMVNMGVDPSIARTMLADPKSKQEIRRGKLPTAMLVIGDALPIRTANIVSKTKSKIVTTTANAFGYGGRAPEKILLRPESFLSTTAAGRLRHRKQFSTMMGSLKYRGNASEHVRRDVIFDKHEQRVGLCEASNENDGRNASNPCDMFDNYGHLIGYDGNGRYYNYHHHRHHGVHFAAKKRRRRTEEEMVEERMMESGSRTTCRTGTSYDHFKETKLEGVDMTVVNDPHVQMVFDPEQVKYMLTESSTGYVHALRSVRERIYSTVPATTITHRRILGLFELFTGCKDHVADYLESRFDINSPVSQIVDGIEEMVDEMPIRVGLIAAYHNFVEPVIGYLEAAKDIYRQMTIELLFMVNVDKMNEIRRYYREKKLSQYSEMKVLTLKRVERDVSAILYTNGGTEPSTIQEIFELYEQR